MLDGGDILERIAGHGNHVREVAGLQLTDLSFPVEQLCAIDQIGLERSEWSHSIFDHQDEFASLCAVREWANIRAHGDRNARGKLLTKFLYMNIEQLLLVLLGA